MRKYALAAVAVMGLSAAVEAKVVTFTYDYSFDTVTYNFNGSYSVGNNSVPISATRSESGYKAGQPLSFAIDTATQPLANLTYQGSVGNPVRPEYFSYAVQFDAEGTPLSWDILDRGRWRSLRLTDAGSSTTDGYYWDIDVAKEAPYNLPLQQYENGGGWLSTTWTGGSGTWSRDDDAVPAPVPLPAAGFLLAAALGAAGLIKRRNRANA